MTTADQLQQLLQTLSEDQLNQVLHFAEFLQHKQLAASQSSSSAIPPGTLTGLRGIAKPAGATLSDAELTADYANYLTQKYQ